MHVRVCPRCSGVDVHRSRRKGLYEQTVLPLLRRRPFRCFGCGYRFYDHPDAVRADEASLKSGVEKRESGPASAR